ncbi:MAG: DNA-binding response regulator [Chloroflexi bacterium]|nr:MAG: DNA-binding response regulator [Chloroflexota bacterium]
MNPLRPSAVLVVEDDPDYARIAQIVLMALVPGIPIEICGVRAEAARALDDLPHGTLVLMDRVLHGVEAFDAIVELRVRRSDVAIVMLSALLSSVDRAYAIACGALDARRAGRRRGRRACAPPAARRLRRLVPTLLVPCAAVRARSSVA